MTTSPTIHHDPLLPHGRQALLRALQGGQVLALPTETVPGLAVLADDRRGPARLSALKGAPPDRPYTLHLPDLAALQRLLPAPPPGLGAWLARRLPGPLTVVAPRDWCALPSSWDWPWTTVGFRVPAHGGFAEIASLLHAPLLMTSINPHGRPPLHGAELAAWLAAHPEVVVGFDPQRVPAAAASTVVEFAPLPQVHRGQLGGKDPLPGRRVLVVCTGNICRSPLAAALLARELAAAWGVRPQELRQLGWEVASAGTFAVPGVPASEASVAVGREIGLDLRGHRAQHLEEALREPWDHLLAMGRNHLRSAPGYLAAELFDPRGHEVPDPFGGDVATYREVRGQLEAAVEARVAAWCGWPQPRAR